MLSRYIRSYLLSLLISFSFQFSLVAQTNYWTHTNDGSYFNIHSFTFVGNEIYTCGSGIFHSSNGGQFWSRINNEFNYYDVVCMFGKADGKMIVGTTSGVYFSSDNGISWVEKDSGLTRGIGALLNDPNDNIFIGAYGPAIFKSTDHGNSWLKVGSFLNGASVGSLLMTDTGTILAGVLGSTIIEKTQSNLNSIRMGGIYRSTNGGASWDTTYLGIVQDLWGNISYQLITSLCQGNKGKLYAGVTNLWSMNGGGVLLSTDDGKTWISTSFKYPAINVVTNSMGFIFVGTPSGIYRSSDDGMQWNQVADSGVTAMAVDAEGNIWVAFNNGGNIAFSTDNGNEWKHPSTGLMDPDVSCLAFNSHGVLFAGTSQGGGIPYTADNGNSWHRSDPITSDWINAIIVNDRDEVFASGISTIYRSINDGHTWDTVEFHFSNLPIYSFCLDSPGNMLASSGGGIFQSTTNGSTWVQILSNTVVNYSVVCDSRGWIYSGSDSGIIRSTNYGNTWIKTNNGLANNSVRILMTTPNANIFAGTWGGGIFRSSNGGDTWEECNSGLTGNFIQSMAVNSLGYLFAGISGGWVCRSINNGSTWQAINSGLTFINNTSALAISPSGYIFAGTFARGVFRSIGSTTSVDKLVSYCPTHFELSQNFPNPFNPNTTIQYRISEKAHVILQIFDILGREVIRLVDKIEEPGNKSIIFDAKGLGSGVYFYRLQVGLTVETKKIMLLK